MWMQLVSTGLQLTRRQGSEQAQVLLPLVERTM